MESFGNLVHVGYYLGLDGFILRDVTADDMIVHRGLGRLPALGEESPVMRVEGIPRPVSAPLPDRSTFRRIQIPLGSRGTEETLKVMADLAVEAAQDPYFVQFSRGVVRDCGERDHLCEADTILQFVKANVKYIHDSSVCEWVSSPGWTMFVDGREDCDGLATVIAAMSIAIGFGARFRAVALDRSNPSEYTHVYAMIQVPGRGWLAADAVPTPARLGWQPPEHLWVMSPSDLDVVKD